MRRRPRGALIPLFLSMIVTLLIAPLPRLASGSPAGASDSSLTLASTSTPHAETSPASVSPEGWSRYAALLAEQDARDTCDDIGWNHNPGSGEITEDEFVHVAACVEDGLYIASCFATNGPGLFTAPEGDHYVLCDMFAVNTGGSKLTVSPLDFTIVDGHGRTYEIDFTALMGVDPADILATTVLESDQSARGVVGFTVSVAAPGPLVLEISPVSSISGAYGSVILDPLFSTGDI